MTDFNEKEYHEVHHKEHHEVPKEPKREEFKHRVFEEPKKEVPKSTSEKSNNNTWSGFQKFLTVVVVLNLLLSFYIVSQLPGDTSGTGPTGAVVGQPSAVAPSAAPSAPVVDMVALMDDDAVEGNPNAPVTIVEFSDYECPFCGRFYSQTYGQLKAKYIDTGKVKLVFRDFPLSFHAQAQKAAEAAECAGEQDKYYEMHDLLFEKGVSGGVNAFKSYAAELGLDTTAFNTCLDSGQMASEIRKDFSDGSRAGVKGTPAFFINGKLLSGAQPIQAFEQLIEAELN
ncbi:MAG: thioredoxin domain-containing protein [Candidatus Woesearchaeota archaeon]